MLRRRSSARSMSSCRAIRSMSRSMAKTACGRPAPRTTVVGTRLISRHHVGPGKCRCGDVGHDDAPRQECSGIVQQGAGEPEDFSFVVDGNGDFPILVAFLRGREKM